MVKISGLPEATIVAATDDLVVVQAGVAKKVAASAFQDYAATGKHWITVPTDQYTPTNVNTSTIDVDGTGALFKAGLPIKFRTDAEATYRYGIITGVLGGPPPTTATVAGASLGTTLVDGTLCVGTPELIVEERFHIPGAYATGVADILASIAKQYYRWDRGKAYLVNFLVVHKTADSTVQPKVNVKVNGVVASSGDGGLGIQLVGAGTWVSSLVTMDTAQYDINRGEALEVRCTAAGDTKDAADLTVICTFVLE